MSEKAIIGLSGGVDSSAAALLLKKSGYDVSAVTLKLFERENFNLDSDNSCCTKSDIEDAATVCRKLEIPHKVVDFGEHFADKVIDYFINSYKIGETPNPCVVCNKTVKFKKLYDEAITENAKIATGHYARIEKGENGRFYIKKGLDEKKDQSYVLYGLSQEILSRMLFPLGEYSKDEIRNFAREAGLDVAEKKDSQDICFIPDGNYVKFIEKYTGTVFAPGLFISADGTVLGKHNGIIGYTVGQRKGLGISSTEPYYVIRKDAAANTVILGRERDLYQKSFTVCDLNFMPFEKLTSPIKAWVRTRYKQKESEALIIPIDENSARVEFATEQKAITPGQSAVFYDGSCVIGGGKII